ncbi:hypothetical protein BB558_001048 [Smittium angustum]|uniref:Uncharacterized protein n=1 Tax=Smittium angustum TaxID=133377 RepID=A0A2U1JCU7_SMIAN|nr:hypothetical protein BB558_001048 [Smittium angustum]
MKTTSLILNTYTVFSEIKPKDIVKKIQKDFAGDINYKKAFRTLSSLKNKSKKINIETLDGCHLRSSFKGVLFSVTALNGDGHNVIIAFGIYPIENNHNRYSSKGSSFSLLAHVERNIGGKEKQFDEYMENIKSKGLDAYSYLENIGFQRWATAKFPDPRYGHITFNIVESTNS